MTTTDVQVRKLMEEYQKQGQVGTAALRAGMHRNTASKYLKAGKLPSTMREPRDWRTRPDPFAEDWSEMAMRLEDAPELEAKALFEDLLERRPERYQEGQLRTFQRRVQQWRAQEGPPKEVFFAQEHRPGEAMQTDFTWATELEITIGGEPFAHLLCHSVLPYSNWQWATPCLSESMSALRRGVQEAVFRLGRRAQSHQTDNSTAATHKLASGGGRGFNEDYKALMRHLGMEPRTIAIGCKEQNGDIEAANGALKRRLEQHLLLRGSRDFESREAYEQWLQSIVEKANRPRQKRLREELEHMEPLRVERLAEFTEERVRVTSWSTIRVKHNTYSVPSRLIRQFVNVRVYEDRLEVYYAQQRQLEVERLRGRGGRRINYRHIIWSLVKKPGAFARYRYREELFPSLSFRRGYDRLREGRVERAADSEYLRILHLAASTMESEVETALELLLEEEGVPLYDRVRSLLGQAKPEVPEMASPQVDLAVYDGLLGLEEVAS
ncbi:MAG: IS21 family transposase [bacterium]|nr:IS21 family transposase [bacterium]